jgi:TolB-like protein
LRSPGFAVSGVMSRFLSYIVNETISQRSGEIKEYSIGIDVLKKPPLYRPSISGIVRVHAGRLRNALDKYYKTQGILDEVIISMPKGRYIPVFECPVKKKTDKIKLAVLPFTFYGNSEQGSVLAENIILLLSTELCLQKNVTVLSGYTARQFISKKLPLKKMALLYGVNYLVTGSIHCENSKLRVYVQLTNVNDEIQIWSAAYTIKYELTDFFGLEDRIVPQLMKDLSAVSDIFKNPSNTNAELKPTENKVYFINSYTTNPKNFRKGLPQI